MTFRGEFYQVEKLRMTPPLAPRAVSRHVRLRIVGRRSRGGARDRRDGHQISEARAKKRPGAVDRARLRDPRRHHCPPVRSAMRGMSRSDAFPQDRKGQITRQLATKVSDSVWHQQLTEHRRPIAAEPYWLVPFQNYKTMCPYLVGSYEQVADEMARYLSQGTGRVILDVPPNPEELAHTCAVVQPRHTAGAVMPRTSSSDLVTAQAAFGPSARLSSLGGDRLTYGELEELSNQLARCLAKPDAGAAIACRCSCRNHRWPLSALARHLQSRLRVRAARSRRARPPSEDARSCEHRWLPGGGIEPRLLVC